MQCQSWEILFSVAFYFCAKFVSSTFKMFRQDLSSIPERNEIEDYPVKWVPKKKHEVLKAKYKCLKKLFQIYDASVIGVLPEPELEIEYADDTSTNRRRKRSHRTKTDACAGTTETLYSGDITQEECESIATETQDLKIKQSCSTQIENSKFESIQSHTSNSEITSNSGTTSDFSESKYSKECVNEKCVHMQGMKHVVPYMMMNDRRKLTRFQSFVQRLFGIRQNAYVLPNDVYAASDSFQERRRRRGLRFRRLRRAKKIKSESDIKDMQSTAILSYVQSAQKSCLVDTTPRQCPMVGCKMMSYGIINYNDHLNLCHFKDRKYICHYCHEGFEKEYDKFIHENEHIGLNKLNTNLSNRSTDRKLASNSNTQTEPESIPDEKLKKIVSFFDKISNPDDIISEIRKNRSSETNLTKNISTTESQDSTEKRTVSCMNIGKCKCDSNSHPVTPQYPVTSHQYGPTVSCRVGDLKYTRQLSLHEDLEHHNHNKFSKFHSCAGIIHQRRPRNLVSDDGRLNVRSIDSASVTESVNSTISPSQSELKLNQGKSDMSLTCDPSTNIVYCTSVESVKQPSSVESLVRKIRYKWEPGTKVIHV